MESFEMAAETDRPRRKSGINKSKWKREIAKKKRYSKQGSPQMPGCEHGEKSAFKCEKIHRRDVSFFYNSFHKESNKTYQDAFLLKYTKSSLPKRCDRGKGGPKKNVSISYYLRTFKGKEIRVCQKAFSKILKVSKYRVKNICLQNIKTGEVPVEKRGGDRISHKFLEKKQSVIQFIKKFHVIELHYCRSKNYKRQFLPSELNIRKMANLYNEEYPNIQVKVSYFRYIFNTHFNIGFKTPSTDVCSYCLRFKEQMKLEKNLSKRVELTMQKRIHTLRAKAFFNKLKEVHSDIITLSFDCQKNLPLPKVPDKIAYYSRQIYLFNFGIVQGSSKSELTKENVFLYIWTEDAYFKGSNQIASALYHKLCNLNLNGIKKIRLVADGCGGQNKNSIIMGMCSFWLTIKAPQHVKSVELIFPITGHSFIPPDRVFAQIEKKTRNKQEIVNPEEYIDILKEHGTIIEIGKNDCLVSDWKTEVRNYFKPPAKWHFQFNNSKRFIITRSKKRSPLIRGEQSYNSDLGKSGAILKKGKNISLMTPKVLEPGVGIKKEKMKDVLNLLEKHFGENWEEKNELLFYKTILESQNEGFEDDDDPICEGHDEIISLVV